MDNNLSTPQDMSMAAISAMANVKEEREPSKNYLNKIILLGMVLFVLIVVGMSIVNFGALVAKTGNVTVQAKNTHTQEVQRLSNQ